MPFKHNIRYGSRAERARFISHKFREQLSGEVLDVGCSEGELKKYVGGHYVGIDLIQSADVIANLDQGCLPVVSNSFNCVVCTDVLEHLENIHFIFDEILRCSRKWVIISLPNNWAGLYSLFFHYNRLQYKFYSLPRERPVDRHRWWFNTDNAIEFIESRCKINGAGLVELTLWDNGSDLKRVIKRSLLRPSWRYRNFGITAIWALIKVNEPQDF